MRLIDADLLKRQMESVCMGIMAGTDSYGAPLETIDNAPTVDAVEVVRCKDCRWLENDGYHTRCRITGLSVEAEDYCSRGERREER